MAGSERPGAGIGRCGGREASYAPAAMRLATLHRTTTAILLAAAATACCGTPRRTAADWLAAGFRGPEQAFHTFQAAFGADELDLEYRCWSAGFKRREGVSQLAYREFRVQLLRDRPSLRCVAAAEIVATERVADDRCRLRARISTLFAHVELAVELVREDYWELWSDDRRVADDAADYATLLEPDGGLPPGLALPPGVDASSVTEIRLGREWKIDAIETVHEDPPADEDVRP